MSEIFSGPNLDSEEQEIVSIRLDIDDMLREFEIDDIISDIGINRVIRELDDSDIIESLERNGYIVLSENDNSDEFVYNDMVDSIDITMLSEIINKFKGGNWEQKERIYRVLMTL